MIKHRKKENRSTERDRERKKEERGKKTKTWEGCKGALNSAFSTLRWTRCSLTAALRGSCCLGSTLAGAIAASAPPPAKLSDWTTERPTFGWLFQSSPASCCCHNITELFDKAHTNIKKGKQVLLDYTFVFTSPNSIMHYIVIILHVQRISNDIPVKLFLGIIYSTTCLIIQRAAVFSLLLSVYSILQSTSISCVHI